VITKIQAAEYQLDTAIRLFFENIDHLSSYTLAAASREITDDLCEKKTPELFQQEFTRVGDALKVRLSSREEVKIYIQDEYYNEAMRLFRARQNFLKHANKDPNGEMDDLDTRDLALTIMFASRNFSLLENRLTPAMSVFLHWFGTAEPNMLKKKPVNAAGEKLLKTIEHFREPIQDLYSKETFKAISQVLRAHYQPR
jgi:hypothetical protein